jgi:hypothetical protein
MQFSYSPSAFAQQLVTFTWASWICIIYVGLNNMVKKLKTERLLLMLEFIFSIFCMAHCGGSGGCHSAGSCHHGGRYHGGLGWLLLLLLLW